MSYTKTWSRKARINFVLDVTELVKEDKINSEEVLRVLFLQLQDTVKELVKEEE